jgi:hypothetical protein
MPHCVLTFCIIPDYALGLSRLVPTCAPDRRRRRPLLRSHSAAWGVVLLVALAATPAAAQTLTRGPLVQNPAALTTTMTLSWWTNVAGNSRVEYGTTPALGQSVTVGQAATCAIGSAGTCHVVPLTGLLPARAHHASDRSARSDAVKR